MNLRSHSDYSVEGEVEEEVLAEAHSEVNGICPKSRTETRWEQQRTFQRYQGATVERSAHTEVWRVSC